MAETRPFKPANDKEAQAFEWLYCANCSKHAHDGCWILLAASIYEPEDPEFPDAWRIGESGPECAAFAPDLRRAG